MRTFAVRNWYWELIKQKNKNKNWKDGFDRVILIDSCSIPLWEQIQTTFDKMLNNQIYLLIFFWFSYSVRYNRIDSNVIWTFCGGGVGGAGTNFIGGGLRILRPKRPVFRCQRPERGRLPNSRFFCTEPIGVLEWWMLETRPSKIKWLMISSIFSFHLLELTNGSHTSFFESDFMFFWILYHNMTFEFS